MEDSRLFRGGLTAIVGGAGGVLSHILTHLHVAFKYSQSSRHTPLFFMEENEVYFVLRPGRTEMSCPFNVKCSLVPIFGPVESVATKGLKWDFQGGLVLGESISCSNEVISDGVTIDSTGFLLWSFSKKFI